MAGTPEDALWCFINRNSARTKHGDSVTKPVEFCPPSTSLKTFLFEIFFYSSYPVLRTDEILYTRKIQLFSFCHSKIVFPLDPTASEHNLAVFLKTNNQFSNTYSEKTNYLNIYSNIYLTEMCRNHCGVTFLNFFCNGLYRQQFLLWILTLHGTVWHQQLVWNLHVKQDEIRITIFLRILRRKEIKRTCGN